MGYEKSDQWDRCSCGKITRYMKNGRYMCSECQEDQRYTSSEGEANPVGWFWGMVKAALIIAAIVAIILTLIYVASQSVPPE